MSFQNDSEDLCGQALQHAETEGLKVVGYYQACERLDDTVLAPVGEKVASKIKGKFEDAIAFVVCNAVVPGGTLVYQAIWDIDRWT